MTLGCHESRLTPNTDGWVFCICEVDVVKVLNKMISAIERSLRLWLIRALLIFVSCHVNIIRMHVATKWARLEEGCLGIATDPCCSKCMYRVFVPDPFVFGFERYSCQVWHCTDMEQKSFSVKNSPRGQKVQKKGRSFCGSPELLTPSNFARLLYGDSFYAIPRRPRLLSRPKEEILLRLPLEEIVKLVGAVPSEESTEAIIEPVRPRGIPDQAS